MRQIKVTLNYVNFMLASTSLLTLILLCTASNFDHTEYKTIFLYGVIGALAGCIPYLYYYVRNRIQKRRGRRKMVEEMFPDFTRDDAEKMFNESDREN